MEVCPLSRGMMLPLGSIPIRSVTERPSLFPSSFTHSPIGIPCGFLPANGRAMGLPCSVLTTRWVRASLSAGGHSSMTGDFGAPVPCHIPFFWLKPISVFGSTCLTTFITSSHLLPIPSTLAPLGLTLAGPSSPRGSDGSLMTVGYIVSGHYTVRSLPALPLRVLLMEQQVLFRN
jgi:hypothetical protein